MVAAAAVVVAWVSALTAAPFLPVPAAGWLYLFGSRICHQIAGRSLHIDGSQLPVCARCYGIYAGAAVVTVAWACASSPWQRCRVDDRVPQATDARVLVTAVVVNLITIGAESIGFWSPSNAVRASAGAALGAAVALVVGGALSKLHYTPWTSTPSLSRDQRTTRT
jgi:uncharacterized membrane protein